MTFREMNLRIFQRRAVPHVLFQPRIEPWYAWHRQFDRLPQRYRDHSLLDLFDDLGVSMRYVHYYTDMPDPIQRSLSPDVTVRRTRDDRYLTSIYETPHGDLVERFEWTVDETWRQVGFPVKKVEDLRKLRWLHSRMTYSFSPEHFERGSAFVGQRGVPQFWVPKSPYQALAQIWMKLQDLIYCLADAPQQVEDTMRAIDDAYDPLYEQLCAYDGVHIINFGENVHDQLTSPRYFQQYFLPFYEKRAGQLHAAGIYSHMHLDGFFRSLLPFLKDLPFDGIEALTPTPQGDVDLEELREHMGDKILLDGIPAVLFLPTYSREELMATAERVVALFHPRLVLGISDELPEGAGLEALERVRLIADWSRTQP